MNIFLIEQAEILYSCMSQANLYHFTSNDGKKKKEKKEKRNFMYCLKEFSSHVNMLTKSGLSWKICFTFCSHIWNTLYFS